MGVSWEYVQDFVKERKEHFAPLHKQIRANRALRHNRHAITIPEAYKNSTQEVRSPIVADILYRVVATLTTDEPTISVPPYAATEKAKRNASLRERWSQASLDRMQRDAGRRVLRMGVDAAVSDGLGIWKIVERADAWANFPRRRRDKDGEEEDANEYLERTDKFAKGQPYPFTWMDVDPLSYLPGSSPFGLREAAEVTTRPVLQAMREFGVYRTGGKFRKRDLGEPLPEDHSVSGQTVECIEYWNEDEVIYGLDGEEVERRPVKYGRPPYFHFGGHTTSSRAPAEMYHSIIQPFAHLIPALDSMLTMMTNYTWLTAYPFIRQVLDAKAGIIAGPTQPNSVMQIAPGSVLRGVEFMQGPDMGGSIKDMVGLFQQMIDRSGLAAIMYGQGASSSSGYMVSQLMTAAQLVYNPIVDNAVMALEQMIPFIWQLIERRKKRKVFVWGGGEKKGESEWMGLGAEDVDGYHACEVELKPLLPMDEIAQRDSAARMVEVGLWSEEHAMEHIGIGQPDAEKDQIAVERYSKSDMIAEMIIQDAARKAGVLREPPAPPVNQGPLIYGPDGQPMPTGVGGPGMPAIEPSVPGQNMPLVPPAPQNAGSMPLVQRQPGGPNQTGPGPV